MIDRRESYRLSLHNPVVLKPVNFIAFCREMKSTLPYFEQRPDETLLIRNPDEDVYQEKITNFIHSRRCEGITKDISAGGISVYVECRSIQVGRHVAALTSNENLTFPYPLLGKILGYEKSELMKSAFSYFVRIKFLYVSQRVDALIYRFIFNMQREYLSKGIRLE